MGSFACVCFARRSRRTLSLPGFRRVCHNLVVKQRTQAGAASPGVVFVGLLALLGAVVAGVIWTGQIDGQPIPPAPAVTPDATEDHSLTDAEAIARFKELDALRIRALEERDLKLAGKAAARAGSVYRRLHRTIRELREQRVFVDEQWRLRKVAVASNDEARIELRAVADSAVRFFDRHGDDVTGSGVPERRTIVCVMRPLGEDEWLLDSCRIAKAIPLEE